MSKSIGIFVSLTVFLLLTTMCGRSIEKRNWERSVEYFLLALGTILYLVKNAPTF